MAEVAGFWDRYLTNAPINMPQSKTTIHEEIRQARPAKFPGRRQASTGTKLDVTVKIIAALLTFVSFVIVL